MSVVAVDVGGTKIAAASVTADGAVEDRRSVPTPAADGAGAVLDAVESLVRALGAATAVGVGSAGVIDPESGAVVSATDTIRDWVGTPLRAELSARLGVPVTVVNDVHAHAAGESWRGAGRGAPSMLVVTAGTGIGGAWTDGGRVPAGSRGAAGHIGHVPVAAASGRRCTCGGRGHVESVASGPAMTAEYHCRGGTRVDGLPGVVAAAVAGDRLAATVLAEGAAALGSALGGLVNVLDPSIVVVAGGVADSDAVWWPALTAAVAAELLPAVRDTPVLPAALGPDAALVGAARLAWEAVA